MRPPLRFGSGVSATVHARGTIGEKVKIKEPAGTEVVHQQITIAPGGHTGWHTHPGAVLVTIKSGTMTFIGVRPGGGQQGRCETIVYPAGSSFVDEGHGHVHIARNLGTTPLEIWASYTGVPPGGAFRIDADDPGC